MRILSIFSLLLLISGCGLDFKSGNGNIEEISQDVDSFEEIRIGGNFDVSLTPSDKNAVVIRADENLIKYINVEVKRNSLNINTIHNLKSSKGIDIIIAYTHLNAIISTGASKITHHNPLKTGKIQIDLSGTGSIELELDVDTTAVNMTGAGLVELSGRTSLIQADISGAGGLIANELIAQNGDISLSGVGGASVNVSEKLEAGISGIGGIKYSGNPTHIEKRITGLGKITPVEGE